MSIYGEYDKQLAADQKQLSSDPFESKPSSQPRRGRGCGCGTCLIGCLGVALVTMIVSGLSVWFVAKKLPDWSRAVIVSVIEDSTLPADQKRKIVVQVDRVVDGYKDGRITFRQLTKILEQLGESPLFALVMAHATAEKYIQPSGMDQEEKDEASITLQRVARGISEQRLVFEDLEPALDYISAEDPNGNRCFHDHVSDEALRNMLAECKRLADEAEIPVGEYRIDVSDEVRRIVDQALSGSS